MQINEITQIIKKEITKQGYFVEERKSSTTNSWYFKIHDGKYSMLFRVSDHSAKIDVTTLRYDKHMTPVNVKRFAINRCKDFEKRKLKAILGI